MGLPSVRPSSLSHPLIVTPRFPLSLQHQFDQEANVIGTVILTRQFAELHRAPRTLKTGPAAHDTLFDPLGASKGQVGGKRDYSPACPISVHPHRDWWQGN